MSARVQQPNKKDMIKPSMSSSKGPRPTLTTAPVAYCLSLIPFPMEFLLFVGSMLVRFYRIEHPDRVVFDESHFGNFMKHYERGSNVFDIHPPLGKMTFAFLATVLYGGSGCSYKDFLNIGVQYDAECKFVSIRAISATFGSLLPPLAYSIARKLGASKRGAFLAGVFVIFDMLNTIESRLILMDAQLMFWSALSLWLGLKFWARWEPRDGSPPMSASEANKWYVVIGIVCGLAIAVKWTALVNPGLVAVESTFGIWFLKKRKLPFPDLLKIAAVVLTTYLCVYRVHFWSLPLVNDRSASFIPSEWSEPYEKTLIGHPEHGKHEPNGFFYNFGWANYEQLLVNSKITQPHHWGSRFTSWIVNGRGVAYWGGDAQPTGMLDTKLHRSIYLLGNPFVIWLCLAGILVFSFSSFFYLRYSKTVAFSPKLSYAMRCCSFLLVGWCLNLAPYAAVERSTFIYHHMPALLMSQILTALFLDRVIFGKFLGRYALTIIGCLSVISFLYWCPWVYALPLTEEAENHRRWKPTWD